MHFGVREGVLYLKTLHYCQDCKCVKNIEDFEINPDTKRPKNICKGCQGERKNKK